MPFVPNPPNTPEYKPPCMSHEHNPPNMIVLPSGYHTWKCPSCGTETTFFIGETSCTFATYEPLPFPGRVSRPDYTWVG